MTNKKHWEGVYSAVRKNGTPFYRSSITYRRKHISLGSYSTPESAHQAYQTACTLVAQDNTITLEQYQQDSALPFGKWVSLLNFRDNGIYFGTPIYIRPRFFYYYLNKEHILKFDLDDLFYYSSHKIMSRGGHYFVADYGMQVNIASRYGIKNYAVLGIDYRFINGDPTDMRRENIEILNCYHGVRAINYHGCPRFSARIHINGYYQIGIYDTAIEAAVAYNKAIDILQKNGVKKNFTPNYIETLSPSNYAELYSSLPINKNIYLYSE